MLEDGVFTHSVVDALTTMIFSKALASPQHPLWLLAAGITCQIYQLGREVHAKTVENHNSVSNMSCARR